jgi:hypothetical protein
MGTESKKQGNAFLDKDFRLKRAGVAIHSRGADMAPVVSNPFHVRCLL